MKIEKATVYYDFNNGEFENNQNIKIETKENSVEKKRNFGGMAWTEITISSCENESAKRSEGYSYKEEACYEYFACMKGEGILLVEDEKASYYVPLKKGALQLVEGTKLRTIFNIGQTPLTVCVFGKDNDISSNKNSRSSTFDYRKENGQWSFYNQEKQLAKIEMQTSELSYDFSNKETCEKALKAEKKYEQIKGAYQEVDFKLTDDQIMYKVYAFENTEDFGKINYGITIMDPICVNGECNMTKGHIHVDEQMTEVYFGLEGNGLLLLKDEKGETFAQEVKRNTVHFIDGRWAHRLINTGDSELRVGAFWNANEKQDYQKVENDPFGFRVFKKKGTLKIEKEQ